MTKATEAWKLIEPYAQRMFDDLLGAGARRGSIGEYPLLLYDGDEIVDFQYSATGMAAAISASASGDVIFQFAGTISGNHTNKAGVTILGQGENSILSGDISNSGILNNIYVTGALTGDGLRINVIRETRSIVSGTFNLLSNSDQSVICGGNANIIQSDAGKDYNVLVGGLTNLIDDDGEKSVIVGGEGNQVYGIYQFIGGGLDNIISIDCDYGVIAGGVSNQIKIDAASSVNYNVIAGGWANQIIDAQECFIGGGILNLIEGDANGQEGSVICGGLGNTINDSVYSIIGGGDSNEITAADYATIPGGLRNDILTGADYAFAQGRRCQVAHSGATLFADSTNADFDSAANDEFAVRASGGIRFVGNVFITNQNELRFYDNGNYVGFEAPALGADQIWTLPTADGEALQFIQTDGGGALAFATAVKPAEWLQNGFVDVSEFTIVWDDAGPRELTIAPANGSFDYYIEGILYTETGTLTETIDDQTGNWAIYIDSEGTLASIKNPSEAQIDTLMEDKCFIAYVYWNATTSDGRLMIEPHGYRMSPATHHYLHDNIGSVFKSGMALDSFDDVDGDGDEERDVHFRINAGEFYDEDVEHDLGVINVGGNFEIWYLVAAEWTWSTETVPGLAAAGGGNRLAYNNAGGQTEVGNAQFALTHVFGTSIGADDGTTPRYILIQGQATYATKKLARAGAETEINALVFGTLPIEEIVPVATIILQTNNGYGNSLKSRIVSTDAGDNYVDWRGSGLKATGGSIADHGALAGLSDDDHVQYALVDGTRSFTGRVTIDDDTSDAPLSLTERAVEPDTPVSGDIYLDDGSNTASGVPGWRRYTGAAWEDIGALAAAGGDITTDDAWVALGDLIAGTGENTAEILNVGYDGEMLYADSGEATGLRWDTAPVAGVHDHADDPGGGQLDWDDIWSDAVHSHQNDAEGSVLTHAAMTDLTLTTALTNQGAAGVLAWTDGATLTIPAGGGTAVVVGDGDWDTLWTDAVHDHSAAGEGGTFDAATLTAGASDDGDVLTSDGGGGAAWEPPSAGGGSVEVWVWEELDRDTLSGTQGSFDFNNISQDYQDLKLVYRLRTDRSAVEDNAKVAFNADTTDANYYRQSFYGYDTNEISSEGAERVGVFTAAGNSYAGAFAFGEAWIHRYTASELHHLISRTDLRRGTTTQHIVLRGLHWETAAAITRITLVPSAGDDFIAGSEVILYGFRMREVLLA